jgi:hypothetical protein
MQPKRTNPQNTTQPKPRSEQTRQEWSHPRKLQQKNVKSATSSLPDPYRKSVGYKTALTFTHPCLIPGGLFNLSPSNVDSSTPGTPNTVKTESFKLQ